MKNEAKKMGGELQNHKRETEQKAGGTRQTENFGAHDAGVLGKKKGSGEKKLTAREVKLGLVNKTTMRLRGPKREEETVSEEKGH